MTEVIRNAEIFAAGQWPGQGANGISFSEADLDGIVAAFDSLNLKGRIPLKMGHDGADVRTADSAPALGWVDAIRRDGNKLLADIRLTSDKLAGMIRAGAYKFVSIELLRNVQAHTRQIPWVLDAVALLGATAPAVGTLKDLQASMQSFRRTGLRLRGERLAFRRENVNPNGDTHDMDEAAVNAAIASAVNKATGDVTAKFTTQIDALKTKLDASESETAKARAQAHRFSVLAPIEAAIANGSINAAAKDHFSKMYFLADDARVTMTTPAQAEEFVRSAPENTRFKGPGAPKKMATGGKADEPELITMTRANVLSFRVEQRVLKLGQKTTDFEALAAASNYTLKTDRHLALQYFDDPQALYEAPATDDKSAVA